MSIAFEKGSGKEYRSHEEIDKLLADFETRKIEKRKSIKRNEFLTNLQEGQMLPNLEKRFADDTTTSSTHSRKKKKKRSTSEGSADSKSSSPKKKKKKKDKKRSDKKDHKKKKENNYDDIKQVLPSPEKPVERIDWLGIATYDNKKKSKDVPSGNQCIIAAPGQSDRELNPYWKAGGSGLPTVDKDTVGVKTIVGDRGLEWYERALTRAQEAAKEQGRSLADVVAERWGSLDELLSLISNAKSKNQAQSGRDDRSRPRFQRPGEEYGRSYDDRRDGRDCRWRKGEKSKRRSKSHSRERSRKRSRSRSLSREKPRRKSRSHSREKSRRKPRFRSHSREKSRRKSRSRSHSREKPRRKSRSRSHSREKSRRKSRSRSHSRGRARRESNSPSYNHDEVAKNKRSEAVEENPIDVKLAVTQTLVKPTDLNALAAKLVKAEILGKTDQVEKLKKQLEEARSALEAASTSSTADTEETVILLKTTKTGMMRPVEKPGVIEPRGGRRKDKKADTHGKDGQRVRYFADDDQRDIRQMFEQEKCGTDYDEKELYLRMATKRTNAGSDEEDAAFADAARMCEADGKKQHKMMEKSARDARRHHKTLDNCIWCLDSPRRAKHLIVAIGETCYLCLPAEEPLTPLHCLLVPTLHAISGVSLDENVWEEIHKFRKSIVAMASALDQDVVFFEQARSLNKHPHMVLHCVVIEKEAGESAPIYFKKALLESESEWSNNKKVVDIKGSDVRGTVPKGLPYFSVEFPPQGGFAHVIEDEKLFPTNFAHSVIGGMLDLDHHKWRKPKNTTVSAQRERTVAFSRKFSKYDFTMKKNTSSSSSSSSSSSDSDSDS